MRKNTLKIINIYYLFTLLYFCFGQYKWNIPSYPKLLIYVCICYIMLNLGYSTTHIGKGKLNYSLYRRYEEIDIDYKSIRPLFLISAASMIFFQVLIVIVFFDRFSITNIFSIIGDNYYTRLHTSFESTIPIMQVRTLLWGLTMFVYPITFLFYKKMGSADKLIAIATIIIDILSSLNLGISKNIGDIVIAVVAMAFLKNATSPNRGEYSKEKRRSIRKITLAIVVFLVIFNNIQSARLAAKSIAINPFSRFASVREVTFYSAIFGANSTLTSLIDRVGGYFSNWYTGLAYALELPFKNTFGIGFSRALMEYANQYLHISVSELTYNARIDSLYGWHNGQWWPTAFVWMANSVSFVFVPLVLFLIGMFIRKLEDEFAGTRSPIVAALYWQMMVLLFYLPCNMQIFQSRAALFGMILLIIIYANRKLLRRQFKVKVFRKEEQQ